MKKTLHILVLFAAAFALQACGGGGTDSPTSGSDGTGTFKFKVQWPADSRGVDATRYVAKIRHNGAVVGQTEVVKPATEGTIESVPAGDATAQVYAYNSDDALTGSGAADFFIKPGVNNSVTVHLDEVPPPVADDLYVMGGVVGRDPENPGQVQITLPALINRADGSVAEGLTEQNFMVYEDNVRKLPITVSPTEGSNSKADIAVVLDTTGSMSSAIAGVRNSVSAFADAIAASGIDVRFAGIDFGDEMRTQVDFTSDVSVFKNWVSGLTAFGGGDGPENPLDAIMVMAEKTNWRPDAQPIILVITDITAHSADSVTPRTVDSVITALRGRFVCHVVAPGAGGLPNPLTPLNQGDSRRNGPTNSEYIDRIAPETGGVWTPFPFDGNVNLSSLPIAGTIKQGYLIRFNSPAFGVDHEIRLIVNEGSTLLADQTYNGHYSPVRK